MIKIIEDSLFNAKTKYIAHQTNCVTNRSAHFSAAMFAEYPYADIYKGRTKPDTAGTIIVRGNGQDQRYVINILGQYYPGSPKFPNSKLDGFEARKEYFFLGLKEILKIPDLESIAFNYRIGCGAAGGDWNFYFDLLEKFSNKANAEVLVYKHEG